MQRSILELSLEQIEGSLANVQEHPFSTLANRYIHRERDRILATLVACTSLKRFMSCSSPSPEDLDQALEILRTMGPASIGVSHCMLSDQRAQEASRLLRGLPFAPLESSTPPGVCLCDANGGLLDEHIFLLGQYCERGGLVVLTASEPEAAPKWLASRCIRASGLKTACLLAELWARYVVAKREVARVQFLFGLAPTRQAPSFKGQTGWLPLLPVAQESSDD